MLSKEQRLNLKTSFSFVAKGGKITTPFGRVFFRLGENQQPKIGISVSKAVFKKAVDRNKAKRLLYQSFGQIYNLLLSNANIIVLPQTLNLDTPIETVTLQLQESLKKLGALR